MVHIGGRVWAVVVSIFDLVIYLGIEYRQLGRKPVVNNLIIFTSAPAPASDSIPTFSSTFTACTLQWRCE